jgi:hypothetical protein
MNFKPRSLFGGVIFRSAQRNHGIQGILTARCTTLTPICSCVVNGQNSDSLAYLEMPIRPALQSEHVTFEPDTIALLAIALEDTLRQLRLVDRNDPTVTMVAKRIIELARRGERDPIRLRDQAIQSFR